MTKKWLAHGLGLLIVAACAGVESGGEFASGRRALMSGDSAVALTYFEPIAKRDPNYVAPFTSFRESIWTYLGRAQYSPASSSKPRVHWKERCPKFPTIQSPSFTSR